MVASAAYRSGEKLHSDYYGEDSDYTHKGGMVCTEILLPPQAPREYLDRETLWNAVGKVEKGKKAQLAYSFDITLQNEFSMEENITLARQFLLDNFVSRGMVVDYAVPTTDWGRPETLEAWKKAWADVCNAKFAEKGLDVLIDHRTLAAQGIDRLPTVHEGPAVRQMEARGFATDKGNLNRWIRETNRKLQASRKKLERSEKRITELKRLFIKIYEDNAAGRLSDERFEMMSQSYDSEQKQLESEAAKMEQEIQVQERQHENLEVFLRKADKYVGIEKLTPYALRELIQGIYVEALDKSTGKRNHPHQVRRHRIHPSGGPESKRNGVTAVTPFPRRIKDSHSFSILLFYEHRPNHKAIYFLFKNKKMEKFLELW